jgi:phage terminase large subunit GpA-like protein
MRLMSMAVDSGEDGVTDNAYKFWRNVAVKGWVNGFISSRATVYAAANLFRERFR